MSGLQGGAELSQAGSGKGCSARTRLYPKMSPLLLQVLTVSDLGLSLSQGFSLQWL